MPRTLSNKQKKIARVASPRNKITGADFKALRKNKNLQVVQRYLKIKHKINVSIDALKNRSKQ